MTASPSPQHTSQTTPSNADQHEIDKFAGLAHDWWDEQGALRTLHAINPLRLHWIGSIAPIKGSHILDVGCGGGILSESLARGGAVEVTGIDLAEESLRVAQLHALEQGVNNVRYHTISAEAIAQQQPAAFDIVTCMEMLEHVPNPSAIVQACAQAVRPGGWVFFSTINRNAKSFLYAIVGAEYVLQLVPRGTHQHSKFIRPADLLRDCRHAGLIAHATQGLHYSPITQRYWLDSNVDVNYMLACRRPE